jgi:hypothetical protein
VTWSPQPGILVAVETGSGLTRDELLTIASNVTPTSSLPSILLVLALTGTDSDGRQAVAVGGVISGEICLTTSTGCTQVLQTSPEPGMVAASAIYSQPTDFGIAGVATGDIASIQATHPDGSIANIHLTRQPVGTTQAFALITDEAVTLTPLDAAGNPIEKFEVSNAPPPAQSATETTISASATLPGYLPSPECSTTHIIEMPAVVGLTVEDATRLLTQLCIQAATTFSDSATTGTGSPAYPSGIIVAQEPTAATPIAVPTSATLTAESQLPVVTTP